nr:MAG TPA: hypothetical protein [Caudoviricetes sp.]
MRAAETAPDTINHITNDISSHALFRGAAKFL